VIKVTFALQFISSGKLISSCLSALTAMSHEHISASAECNRLIKKINNQSKEKRLFR
jgi:hypothetical protein